MYQTQKEKAKWEEGRRDGYKDVPEQSDNPIYLDGWRAGVIERISAVKKKRTKR